MPEETQRACSSGSKPSYDGCTSWTKSNPYTISLAAGAIAGMSAELVLFPLDCMKTRVQSRQGFRQIGGFRGFYRGCGTAIAGSAPASAIFFSTYECSKRAFVPPEGCALALKEGRPDFRFTGAVVLSSVLGELAAASIRVPVDLMKQRLQAGYKSSFLLPMDSSIFLASFQATAMRDITHSSLQYPLYEYLKLATAGRASNTACCEREGELPPWLAAVCGSVAGIISAVVTTPFDLLKTRLNLRGDLTMSGKQNRSGPFRKATALVSEEIRQIYDSRGLRGFFTGALFRALWMGLGGFVFLGSFELAKNHLSDRAQLREGRGTAEAPQASASADAHASHHGEVNVPPLTVAPQARLGETSLAVCFAAGLVAGAAVDVPLHPVDTLKTRLQAREGFAAAGGARGVWCGLSAVLVMSLPGSAMFFVMYEHVRHLLDAQAPTLQAVWRDAAAASIADVSACVVRVPSEVVKQRMQTRSVSSAPAALIGTIQSVHIEGLRGFFAGFGATVSREVPFALIQMPLFEELKVRHPWAAHARATGDSGTLGLIGMMSGGLAGAAAGALTTPLDTAKTRIMLTTRKAERAGLVETLMRIHAESGTRGLLCGITPRTLHCGTGGALWLGAFEWAKLLLSSGP